MSSSLLRYNAYTGIRNAGIIRVRSVEEAFRISKLQVAKDYMLARLAALRELPAVMEALRCPCRCGMNSRR